MRRNGAAGFHVEARCELATALAGRASPGRPGTGARSGRRRREAGRCARHDPVVERPSRLAERLDEILGEPLTAREREVAALVAQGLTNREIAGRLYLSERTAQNHVQHILTKLGLPNRGQIAVWMTTRS